MESPNPGYGVAAWRRGIAARPGDNGRMNGTPAPRIVIVHPGGIHLEFKPKLRDPVDADADSDLGKL